MVCSNLCLQCLQVTVLFFYWFLYGICSHLTCGEVFVGFFGGLGGKESACSAGDPGSVLGSGRFPGEGNGYPLQYSCLENSMDRGAWQAIVHGVAKSWNTTGRLTLLWVLLRIWKTKSLCAPYSLLPFLWLYLLPFWPGVPPSLKQTHFFPCLFQSTWELISYSMYFSRCFFFFYPSDKKSGASLSEVIFPFSLKTYIFYTC